MQPCFFTTGAGHSIGSLHTRPNPVPGARHGKIVALCKGQKYVHIHLRGEKKRREIDRIKYVNLGVSYGSRKLINKPVDL